MLFVVLRPARRETVGADAERRPGDCQDDGEELVRQAAPASASSTSVACDTPVAPRAPNGSALR